MLSLNAGWAPFAKNACPNSFCLVRLRYDGHSTSTSNIIILNATIKGRVIFFCSLLSMCRQTLTAAQYAVATDSAACLGSIPEQRNSLTRRDAEQADARCFKSIEILIREIGRA